MKRKEIIFIIGIMIFLNWLTLTVVIKDHIEPEFLRYTVGFYTGAIFAKVVDEITKED